MATERKIGAHVYRCDKLPASEGLSMYMRVAKLFVAAPDMIASIAAGNADKVAMQAFAILSLSEALNPEETHALLIELAQTCKVGADQCIVGVKPAELEDLVKVAWYVMEVNFQNFLAVSLAES